LTNPYRARDRTLPPGAFGETAGPTSIDDRKEQ
jgi:hypothetical protein